MGSGSGTSDAEALGEALEMTEWGAPRTHDGSLPTESVIWIDHLDNITEEGWQRIFQTRQITWVIIPLRTK
jgi:hypothetical protein